MTARGRLGRRVLNRVRHAKHPLTGWRRWAVIAGEATAGIVFLFAAINLALSLSTFRGDDPDRRMVHELTALWHSPMDGRAVGDRAFAQVYPDLGPQPSADQIRAYLTRQAADGEFLFDHALADHIVRRFGRVDARTVPAGVYVGAHALGPDGPPFVPVTKYLAHYLLFPRHAYILVVPEHGGAVAFSASTNGKLFRNPIGDPDILSAEIAPYDYDAYDFPSSGQALHEMTLVSSDRERMIDVADRIEAAIRQLETDQVTYGLLAPNSNTVIGCILEGAGEMSPSERSTVLLALRAPGFGAACV